MNRRKTPEERTEEAMERLRDSVRRGQEWFRRRLKERAGESVPPPPGLSIDTGKEFDSALLPPEEQNPPAKKDDEPGGDERLDLRS